MPTLKVWDEAANEWKYIGYAGLGYTAEDVDNKGEANGYAPLDAATKIPSTYLPALSIASVVVQATEPESPTEGMVWVDSDTGVSKIYDVDTTSWYEISNTSGFVTTVNGENGPVISLSAADVGAASTSHGSTHVTGGSDVIPNVIAGGSSGLITGADKTKLDGIATGANNYVLPTAAAGTLGGVKIGNGIDITDGVISVDSGDFATVFTELNDAPTTYVGNGGLFIKVNNEATALEFSSVSIATNAIQWDGIARPVLTDNALKYLRVNSDASALEFASVSGGAGTWGSITGDITTQTDLYSEFATVDDSRFTDARTPTAHNLIDTTGHPVSGLTTGHFLKATGATTYAFGAHGLTASDVGALASGGKAADSELLDGLDSTAFATAAHTHLYQPLDSELTSLAGLSLTGNGGKVISVKSDVSGFELTTPATGGDITTDGNWVAAGDLIVGTGENTASILSKGTTGQVLKVGSSTLEWGAASGGSVSEFINRTIEGVVYETTFMYWVAGAACEVATCNMYLGSNPSASTTYCKVQAMKNGLLETDSIFTSDTPMTISDSTSATNGIYGAYGTLDGTISLAAGDVLWFRVDQADAGSADLLVRAKVTYT